MDWFMRPRKEMHKFGDAECPDYKVVDAENAANWTWFISKLKEDLNMENDAAWTFISDKQKGLINALEELCPNVEHRFCAMHLYSNMSKIHKGLGLRGLMWSAARSTTDYHFDKNMDAIKKMNLKCYEWLAAKPKEQWSRCGFRTLCKSDMFVNNDCEVFNASIKKIRHLPIVTMLRHIQSAVMRRIQKIKHEAETWVGKFTPNSLEKLAEANKKAVDCQVTWSGGPRFLVQTSAGGFEIVVDLFEKTCHCKKWQLRGVPCFHAVACMNSRRMNLEDGLHNCYSIAMFQKEFWTKTPYTQPLPPNVKPSTGRPKLKRSRKNDAPPPDSTKFKRQKTSLRCGTCNEWGHNRRGCKAKRNVGSESQAGAEAETQAGTEAERQVGDEAGENNEVNEENVGGQNPATEIAPGASQPTDELHDSQGGVFEPPPARQSPSTCGVVPKS